MGRAAALFLAGCLMIVSGCGYTTGSLLPSNYRTISVEPFKNNVAYLDENVRRLYIPLLEVKVRDTVVSRFRIDGHLKVAKEGSGDLILKGTLLSFDRDDIRVSENEQVQQYRLRVTVALVLIDAATGQELWSEPSFAGEASYYTSGAQAKSEDAAIQDALVDLGRRIVERTLENW